MKLTVYAIAKNEESCLPLMLESVKDIADEIVVCDTGSTDGTIEIARAYTDKVYSIPWENSFAKARNLALEHCTGDWILSMDCDERLDPETAKQLKSYIESLPPDIDLVLLTMVMCKDDGVPFQEFLAERIFRGNKGIRFAGDMHNWLEVEDSGRVSHPSFKIIHCRGVKPPEIREARARQRLEMAEAIFLPKIEANPNDRRSMFYLAGTYYDSGSIEKSIEWFEKYLAISDWGEERYQAAFLLAQACMRMNDKAKARRVLSAHLIDNWRRAEAYVMLGQLALTDGDYRQAEWWFKAATLKPQPVDPLFVEPDAHTFEPHLGLWTTYRQIGDNQKAYEHGRMAVELGAPNAGEICRFAKNHTAYGTEKVAVMVDRGQMDFISPVIRHWERQGKVVRVTSDIEEVEKLLNWADLTFCEWAGDLAVAATKLPKQCRIVVRVHGYETHSGHIQEVDWAKVDDVLFVADYLRDLAVEQAPIIAEACNTYVVPGGVESEKYSIGEEKNKKRIAMAAYGNQKKNFPLALQILAKCPADYELHIATEWQDHRLHMYVNHLIEELGLSGRVFFHPWQTDLNEFYKDKDYYLSSSEEESFHYALAEAMAAGLKPVIHCWKSARDFYEDRWIWRTVDEAVEMLSEVGSPDEYRQYAIKHLDIGRNLKRIDRIIERPSVAVADRPGLGPYSWAHKIGYALESIGCRADAPEPKVVIITGHDTPVEDWMDGAVTVLWHCEQVIGDDEHAVRARERIAATVPQVDLVLTHNLDAKSIYEAMGAKRVEYLSCVVASRPFRRIPGVEKEFDVGFCGYVNDRRRKILEELGERFDVHVLENDDHEQVNLFYNKCKVVLNLHCTDEPNLETRIGEALAAGACVVSEQIPITSGLPTGGWADIECGLKYYLDGNTHDFHSWIWRNQRLEHQVEKILEMLQL